MLKYLNNKDISPIIGSSIGSFGVASGGSDKQKSGFSLNLQAGYVFFRTYDINLIVKCSFYQIFNSDMDNGVGLEIGTATRPPSFDNNRKNKFYTLGLIYLFFMIMSSASR